MPGHDTSSFVSRDRGLAGVIDGRIFAPQSGFGACQTACGRTQYMTPIFRRMAKHASLDFQVAYCTLRGAEAGHDPEFGANIQWDVPVLDGHSWTHVPNRGSGAESFFGLWNPNLWKLIRSGNYDAVLCFIGYVRATFWIAYMASKFSKAAFIFGADATSLTPRDGLHWKITIKKFLWPRLFHFADQFIVPSSDLRDFISSLRTLRDPAPLTASSFS